MEGLVDYVRRQVKCPECRAEHRIPYNGIQGFPANVTLQRFLEAQIEITGETPDPHTGQFMERCGVCNEKNYLSVCAHCEKKICEGCKNAHSDVVKREIGRINNQVKRASHRLNDQLNNVSRNISALKSNTSSVSEEIENISKRLQKAIRDREDYLKSEVQNQFNAEMRSMQMLHDGLEQEISNVNSNIELAEKHMDDETPWSDGELMDTKEIFLKTMEFIRSFDFDSGGDHSRKTRFLPPDDLNKLASTLSNMGELNVPSKSGDPYATAQSFSAGGLSKSKSDHRLAVQFRDQEGAGKTSPVTRRRFGDRPQPVVESEDSPEMDSTRRRFKSRFIRREEEEEEKSVKFSESESRSNRPKCFDTEDVSRGPLSGIVRILDSPRVIQRIQERDVLIKRRKEEAKNPTLPVTTAAPSSLTNTLVPPRAARQISEDEIDKIKKQNKSEETTSTSNTVSTANSFPYSSSTTSDSSTVADRLPAIPDTTDYWANNAPSQDYPRSSDVGASSTSNGTATRSRYGRNGGSVDAPDTSSQDRRYSRDNSTESNLSHEEPTSSRKNSATSLGTSRLTSLAESSSTKPPSTTSTKPSRYENATNGTSRYSSRFLGRAATPSAETSKEDLNNDEEEDESSEESESDDTEESSEEEEEKTYTSSVLNSASNRSQPTTTRSRNSADYGSRYTNANNDNSSANTSSRYNSGTNGTSSSSTYNRRPSVYENKKEDESESKYGYSGSKYLSRNRNEEKEEEPKSAFQSRFLNRSKSSAVLGPDGVASQNDDSSPAKTSGRARFEEMKEKRQRLARSKSSAGLDDEDNVDTSSSYKSKYSRDNDIKSNVANRALGPSTNASTANRDESGSSNAQLSNWARYLKNKYGNKNENSSASGVAPTTSSLTNRTGVNGSSGPSNSTGTTTSSSTARAIARSRSSHLLGLPKEGESSEDDLSKNVDATPTFPAPAAAAGMLVVPTHPIGVNIHRNQYLKKGKLLFQIGSRGSDPEQFTWPRGVAVGPNDSIVVADSSNHRVQVFDGDGQYIKDFGSYGTHYGEFDCLAGIAVNRIGQFIISDRYNHRIQVFDPSGTFLRTFGSQGGADGKFSYPWGVATDSIGFIYVCDKDNHRIQVFQSDGTFVGKFGGQGSGVGQLEHPHYIAVSSTNKVIVSDSNNHRIQIFDVNGKIQSSFGGQGAEEGKFKFPRGVAVDDDGYIIVADSGNNRVQVFDPDGLFVSSFGRWGSQAAEFKGLEGCAVTAGGRVLVSDRENHRVQVF